MDGVRALGGFTRQHDTICTIENGVGYIADFGTSRTGVDLHERNGGWGIFIN